MTTFASSVLRTTAWRLLKIQALIVLICTASFLLFDGAFSALAVIYGGGITLAGTAMMAYRINLAAMAGGSDKHQGYLQIYAGVIQKFFLTLLLIALGMGYFELDPLALLVGFIAAQLGYLWNKVDTSPRLQN